MQRRFIRIRELASSQDKPGMLPVSAPTVWRWVRAGAFPPPVRLGPGVTAWPVEAVEAFLARRAEGAAN